jgi:hypothetical protein
MSADHNRPYLTQVAARDRLLKEYLGSIGRLKCSASGLTGVPCGRIVSLDESSACTAFSFER